MVLGPEDTDRHGAIRGKAIAFESYGTGLRGGHLQNTVIPFGLGLKVLAGVNCGAVSAVASAVAVEDCLGGSCVDETSRDYGDTLPFVDRHGASLNHGLAGKIAAGGDQRPGAVQGAMVPG